MLISELLMEQKPAWEHAVGNNKLGGVVITLFW